MVALADIKKDLSGWPDDVIDQWVLYLANREDTGWPPPEPLAGSWAAILGQRPLSWWRDVTWKLESVDCSLERLAPKTRRIATDMRADIAANKADAVTQRRFNEALFYLLNNGAFPKPPITMKTGNGLLALDGNHRVAAFTAAQIIPPAMAAAKGWKTLAAEQEVWVGTHKSGEVPLS